MKRFDELVAEKLGEIVTRHGRSPISDPKLCENLLKDYCGEHKEEIALLVLAVKERIATDLLFSRDGLPREMLRALLIKRLRKHRALSAGDATWAVESWASAILTLSRSESNTNVNENGVVSEDIGSGPNELHEARVRLKHLPRFGILGQCRQPVRSVAVSPLGGTIASGGDDSTIRMWQTHSGEMTMLGQCEGPVLSVAFSPNGVLIASASEADEFGRPPRVQIRDLHSGEVLTLGECGRKSPSLVFSPGGKSLAAASAEPDGVIRVWNLQTGQTRVFQGNWNGPASISFSADGRWIAAADGTLSNPSIRLWDMETGTARTLGNSSRQITSVAFAPDGSGLASGSWDESVRLWNIVSGEARILGENCSCISCLAFSPKGNMLAAYSLDSRLRVWQVETAKSHTIGVCHNVNALAYLMDGRVLVTGDSDGAVRLWDATL